MTLTSFIKEAYKEEWPTIVNNLIANGIAGAAAAGTSHLLTDLHTGTTVAAATAVDIGTFWTAFLGQLAWRDRKNFDGKRLAEYATLGGILELSYIPLHFIAQYTLQEQGLEPAEASAVAQAGLVGMYTAILPPLRYGIQKIVGTYT